MKKVKINFLKIFKRFEIPLASGIIIIFSGILTYKLLIPNLFKAREMNEDGKLLRKKITNLSNKKKILSSVDERLLRDNFIKLNYVVPDNKDYVLLFTTLDQLQQKIGISITRTDFQLGVISTSSALLKRNKTADNYIVPVTLEVIGTIEQLQSFLGELSNLSGRLITAEQIKIEVLDFGLVKAIISGRTYFNPLPEQLGPVETEIPEFNQNYQEIFKKILENQYPIEVIEETQENVPVGKNNLFL
ncbi:hypothetical protein A3I51_04430 [Candidatus Gottesmanbacteria bacterium RIFCSPLOWO2_02_FULL_38_8]|uniref:Uncharacterized protein n=1 Tax=Candidatus Gottesmanbacteria bacterium RIFCSPLOWO2_02_FULL_38_8 TaxID=1798397 RepID=A0A1F6B3N9_9BACT|nr:MAG: hypothetical protein A3I51_04430 [Candidatus Gottesmanbacteria bacterium RIFCSPLOWO2_02_FULL_38_8]